MNTSIRPQTTAVLVGVIFLVLVYAAPLGSVVSRPFARTLPFPAGRVGFSLITMRDALTLSDGLRAEAAARGETLDRQEANRQALSSLVRSRLVHRLLREQDAAVRSDDVETFFLSLQTSEITNTFGWSEEVFKRFVGRPYLESRSLQSILSANREFQKQPRERIEQAATLLEQGTPFDQVVLQYSEDASSVLNGYLGTWSMDEVPEAWRPAAEALEVSAISPVIEDAHQFSLVRVDLRDEGAEATTVRLSGIIVLKRTFQTFLDEAALNETIRIYVRP